MPEEPHRPGGRESGADRPGIPATTGGHPGLCPSPSGYPAPARWDGCGRLGLLEGFWKSLELLWMVAKSVH